MIFQELDIRSDFKDSSSVYEHVIFGTFRFDPIFFEEKILPIIKSKDARNVVVLIDRAEYQSSFENMTKAGQEYYVDYCYANKKFHPKFMLAIWDTGIKLVMGSSNLTKAGWFSNAELVVSIEYNTSKKDDESIQILSEFGKFLALILEKKYTLGGVQKNYIPSEKHRDKIQEILKELTEKLPTTNKNNKNSFLIHNLEKPILDQVKEIIGPVKIKHAKILAPFFNEEGSVVDYLVKNGCNEFDIFVQPDHVEKFPKEIIKKLIKQGKKISIHSIKFQGDEERYFHAKALILNTDADSYCLYGSANPTYSGMCSLPTSGNLELCVLRKEDCDYFDNLVSNKALIVKDIRLEDIISNKQNWQNSSYEKIRIVDTYLDAKVLKLELDYDGNIDNRKILLCHADDDLLEIPTKSNEGLKFEINLNEKEFSFCGKNSTYVKIQVEKSGDVLESDKRWISTQTLELTPTRGDILKIKNSNGRFHLITFLNKLEKYTDDPEWLIYHLQSYFANFDKFERLERTYRRIKEWKAETVSSDYDTAPKTDVKSIEERYQKNFSAINDAIPRCFNRSDSEIKKIFDQFMLASTVIIWSFNHGILNIDCLRHIRVCIEKFTNQCQYLYKDNHSMRQEVDRLRLLEHLLVFSFLINKFHKDAGWYSQWERKKHPEKNVFEKTATDLVKTFELGKKKFLKGDFENEMKKDYDGFENLEISHEDISEYYEKIRDGLPV